MLRHLLCILHRAVGSVFFAWKSGCKAVMAGPDLLPGELYVYYFFRRTIMTFTFG